MDERPVINYVGNVFEEVITAINALQKTGHSEADINAVLRRMGVSYGADRSRADRIEMTYEWLARYFVTMFLSGEKTMKRFLEIFQDHLHLLTSPIHPDRHFPRPKLTPTQRLNYHRYHKKRR